MHAIRDCRPRRRAAPQNRTREFRSSPPPRWRRRRRCSPPPPPRRRRRRRAASPPGTSPPRRVLPSEGWSPCPFPAPPKTPPPACSWCCPGSRRAPQRRRLSPPLARVASSGERVGWWSLRRAGTRRRRPWPRRWGRPAPAAAPTPPLSSGCTAAASPSHRRWGSSGWSLCKGRNPPAIQQ